MRHILLFACLALALLAPLGSAGLVTDPEVQDPKGDGGADALDLLAVWVDPADAQNLTFHVTLAAAPPAPPEDTNQCASTQCAFLSATYRILFRVLGPDGAPAPAIAGYNGSQAVYRAGPTSGGLASPTGWADDKGAVTYLGNATVTVTGAELVYRIPRSNPVVAMPAGAAPGAYTIDHLLAYSSLQACIVPAAQGVSCAPLDKPGQSSGTPPADLYNRWDVAPDTGFGRPFTFPAAPQAVPLAPLPDTNGTATGAADPPSSAAAPAASTTGSATLEPAAATATVSASGTASSTSTTKASPAVDVPLAAAGLAAALLAARRRLR